MLQPTPDPKATSYAPGHPDPYRDPQACPIPSYTIDALPPTGIVISTNASRDWSTLPTRDPLPHHLSLPARLSPPGEGGWRY